MVDIGMCYFCCDECPLLDGFEHRLKLAEEFGELQYYYCYCDKVDGKLYISGYCSDAFYQKPQNVKNGKRRTGRKYRREKSAQKFERLKQAGVYYGYHPTMGYVDWDFIDGHFVQVGKYMKYPKNSKKQKYFKRYSNRRVRSSDDIPTKGNAYRKEFDYAWTLW